MEKIVNFNLYCPICKYYHIEDTEDPCDECLSNATNDDSHKPILFKYMSDKERSEQIKNSKKGKSPKKKK